MNWPQIVWIVLASIAVGIHLANHGEQRKDKYNFWIELISFLIEAFLLWKGGFFGG